MAQDSLFNNQVIKIKASELSYYQNNLKLVYSVDSVLNNDSLSIYTYKRPDKLHLAINDSEYHLSPNQVFKFLNHKIDSLNKIGFALARIDLQQSTSMDSIKGVLIKGKTYRLDSISLTEKVISSSFIEQALKIRKGDLFNIQRVKAINERINEIPFLKLKSEPLIYFYDDQFKIKLNIEKIGTNEFNGIVGLVPDNSNPEITRYRLNGNLNLATNNLLKQGENFEFRWNRASDNIQTLITKTNLPFLFGTPYSIGGELNFLQKDSSFLNVNYSLSAAYQPQFNRSFSILYKEKISTVTNNELNSQSSNSNSYGIAILLNEVNDLIMPLKGWNLRASCSIGERRIQNSNESESSLIEIVSGNNVSTTLEIPNKSNLLEFEFNLDKYWQIKQRFVLLQEIKSQGILNPYLFQNELLFTGGINSIRGIDNSSVSASQIHILRNEFRFHLERYSFLAVFADYSSLTSDLLTQFETKSFVSTGLGTQVSSKAGVFSLYYALSKQDDQAIFLRDAKIHIGFKNLF